MTILHFDYLSNMHVALGVKLLVYYINEVQICSQFQQTPAVFKLDRLKAGLH